MTPTRRRILHGRALLAIALPAILIVGSPLRASTPPQIGIGPPSQSDIEFLRIDTVETGEVRFDLPSRFDSGSGALDWEELAEEHFDEFDFVLLDPHQTSRTLHTAREHAIVRRLASSANLLGNTEVPYDVPLPADLVGRDFFAISPAGIHALRPTHLVGIVTFRSNLPGTVIFDLTHYGYGALESLPGSARPESGFALEGRRPTITGRPAREVVVRIAEIRTQQARIEAAQRRKRRGQSRGRQLWHPVGWDYRPVNSFTFRVAGVDEEYVFVQWAPDFCEIQFEISRRDRPEEVLAAGGDGCDI